MSATKAKEEKDKEYTFANRNAKKAKQEKDQAEKSLEQYKEDIVEQTKKQKMHEAAYHKIMEENDISEFEWKDLTEKHRKTEIADIQSKIDVYNKKKAAHPSLPETRQKSEVEHPAD